MNEITKTILKERILQGGETWDEMVARVVDGVFANTGHGDGCREGVRELIHTRTFLPNSPTLMNAGTKVGQLCACFVLPIEDSMEGIFTTLKQAALVQKSGGGTGFSFNRLRPRGAMVNSTGGQASGPVSFLKVFNSATNEIEQGGRRRGASLGTLNVDHDDILDFIRCKRNTDAITNFNISVGMTDEFMAKIDSGDASEHEREIWDEIVKNAWETGEPGLLFLDCINRANPTPEIGEIETCNPCGESVLLPYEACVLGSLDLSKFITDGSRLDFDSLRKAAVDATIFLDSVINASTYPIPEIEKMTKGNRKIGLGVMGWANALYKMGIPYDSEEAVDLGARAMGVINNAAIDTSKRLAFIIGPFPNLGKSIYSEPRRNASVTSIAPTGTLADIAGTTYGIEPEYALVHTRRILDGKEFTVVNPAFKEELERLGLDNEYIIEEIRANGGSIQGMTEFPEETRNVFKVAHDISVEDHIGMQSAFQMHVEQSISKTLNLPESATRADVEKAYIMAWRLGCKGATVYRDGARPAQVLSAKYTPSERPMVLKGRTYKFSTGCGSLYVTVNKDLAGDVHEVFTVHSKNSGCVAALLNALARVTSIALRSGVDPDAIVKTMLGQDCGKCKGISSCADAVGLALGKESTQKVTFCDAGSGTCEFCG